MRTASGSMAAWSLWSKSRTATRERITPRSMARSRIDLWSILRASKHTSDWRQMMASMPASFTRRSRSAALLGQDPTMMLEVMGSQLSVHFHSSELPWLPASSLRFMLASCSASETASTGSVAVAIVWTLRARVVPHVDTEADRLCCLEVAAVPWIPRATPATAIEARLAGAAGQAPRAGVSIARVETWRTPCNAPLGIEIEAIVLAGRGSKGELILQSAGRAGASGCANACPK
mmetsp:Transcript_25847/g.82215  ORF Transcript_25847/g.82215 Transcript_25847/m.82215 type:complete len:234 (+) Transcript_25847:897-1598(+)